ncbi:MAG: alpha/beta hydrolase [Treponema sp.]|nr:alpha/beta hydrolase [Treponema sp.]
MRKIRIIFAFIFSLISFGAYARGTLKAGKPIYLWKNIPGMKKNYSVMYVHPAPVEKNTGAAVIICPGGSYHHLGLYNEGYRTAKWFSEKGVTAFTLRYRTAGNGFHYPAMLQDVQRAIQLVRENCDEYGIDSNKVGVIGYSAGGHLVTMAGAMWKSHDELENLGIAHEVSLRPDFVIPVYPVVSMHEELAHRWSRKSLLGRNQTEARWNEFSMEKNVTADMPKSYIVVCKDDPVVDCRNSFALYDAMKDSGADCSIAVYEWGGHGFGMLNNAFMKEFHWNERMWQEFLEPILK